MKKENYIFISYSKDDLDYVTRLRKALLDRGIRVWTADRDIPAGESYPAAVKNAIKDCCAVLLILSSNSLSSEYVKSEMYLSYNYSKKRIPVMREPDLLLNDDFEYFTAGDKIIMLTDINENSDEFIELEDMLKPFTDRHDENDISFIFKSFLDEWSDNEDNGEEYSYEEPSDEKCKYEEPSDEKCKLPPIELLTPAEETDDDESEINENIKVIIETLASFNVMASIKGIDRGPRITRYEIVPARGVKVNDVINLFDDIALTIARNGIRMEAPIPGKSAIGLEIPNKKPKLVRLRELIESEEFKNSKSSTFVAIGKDVEGLPVFADIEKFPHAIIAGATGMGKSACINSMLLSILYKSTPNDVKFILIDPKKVEFTEFASMPHLLVPIITDAKEAAGSLMWAVTEMERRYTLIENARLRNISAYNEAVENGSIIGEKLPKIVIVIDELYDLMIQVKDPIESLIMRLAQKSRAAGIYLIMGTQRPDSKVLTGTIKANVPTRICCKVSSVYDSRTVIEMAGAEKLLDKGDMLFKPIDKPKPIRVQGAFVSDSEVEAIMKFLKEQVPESAYDDDIFAEIKQAAQKCGKQKTGGAADLADDGDEDEGQSRGCYSDQQFLDAVHLAITSKKISTSLLQRRLSIGYAKAAMYIDEMEAIGVVSEPKGQKPRDVLITMDEWNEMLTKIDID